MQRVHEKDLCGYLLEQDPEEWTVLSLPCIKSDGTALWEFKHTIEELNKLKEDNETVFERQYQQDPKPLKGLCFPEKQLKYFDLEELPKQKMEITGVEFISWEAITGYIDVADVGNDSLSFPVGKNLGKEIYITDVLFTKKNADTTRDDSAKFILDNKIDNTRIESNNMGNIFGRDVKKLVPEEYNIRLINNDQNKHTRIIMQAAFIIKYCNFLKPELQPPHYKKFMKELCAYQKEVKKQLHDDAPDSLSGLALYVRRLLSDIYN